MQQQEDVQVMDSGSAEEAKKVKAPDAIRQLLKKKPQVDVIDGTAVYISQQTSIPMTRRYGLPVLDRKTRQPKAFLGAFKNADEVLDWLTARKAEKNLSDKRWSQAVDDLTAYTQLSNTVRAAFEAEVGVLAQASAPKPPAKKAKKDPNVGEKKTPEAKKSTPETAKKAGSGGFLRYAVDAVPSDKAQFAAAAATQKVFKQLSDAMEITDGDNQVARLEVVTLGGGGVLVRQMDAPNKSVLKLVAKLTRTPLESLTVSSKAKEDKFCAILKRGSLKAALAQNQAELASAAKKEKKAKTVEVKSAVVEKKRAQKSA